MASPPPSTSRRNSQVRFADATEPVQRRPYPSPIDELDPEPLFSAVPLHPAFDDDNRRVSDVTLTSQPDQPKVADKRSRSGSLTVDTDRSRRRYSDPYPPPPLPPPFYGYPYAYDYQNGAGPSAGLFTQIKDAFNSFSRDQQFPSRPGSQANSRKSSWAGSSVAGKEPRSNFERSLAINDESEETYLYDDDPIYDKHRDADQDKGHQPMTKADIIQNRKSYHERRKKENHYIKFCSETMEEYQKFILTFAKALLSFGSPSHRIEAQLNSLAKVFRMEAQFFHTTGTVQVSFGNPESRSSETCLIKAQVGLALSRIHAVHNIYRSVLHDDMFASQGTKELQRLLAAPPRYGPKSRYLLAFLVCFLICGVAFGGSFNDMWVAGLMGLFVRTMQNIAAKSELSASGSEVFTAALVALVARGVASVPSHIWCFEAISSAGVISMLPGYLILSGSLDIAGKNPALGAPKIVSGIMTSLYLGFGLTLGSDVFLWIDRPASRALALAQQNAAAYQPTVLEGTFTAFNGTSRADNFTGTFIFSNSTTTPDTSTVQGCFRNPSWPWYLQPLPQWSLIWLVPLFALCSSMNSMQHWWSRQMLVMVVIACVSFGITRAANLQWGLSAHPDYVSLLGSWIVGILGNGYSRRFGGTAFTAMLTGILLLVPDGLSAAGGLAQNYHGPGQDEYTQSLTLARKMISVIIGIMAGVYSSAAIVYFFGKKKNAALVTF